MKNIVFFSLLICWFNSNGQNVPELLYYKFDGNDSIVVNNASSPVGNNPAIIFGNQYQGSLGQFARALVGAGGYSNVNFLHSGWTTNVGSSDWTISLWIDANSSSLINYFFGQTSGSFRCFTGGTAGTGLYLRGGGLTDVFISGSLFSSPSVVTYVFDSSASNVYAYVNGQLAVTQAQSGTVNLSGGGIFKVGGYGNGSGCLNGKIDEFRFYGRALDSNEVTRVYNKTLPLPTALNDAGLTNFISPTKGCFGQKLVEVEIANLGINQIDSLQIHWSVNGQTRTPYFYYQLLDTLYGNGSSKDTVALGYTNFSSGATDTIIAWTAFPNNMPDTMNGNDTSSIILTGISNPIVDLGNDTIICLGNSTILDAGYGHDSIIWFNSSRLQTLIVDTVGIYSVKVFENGCESTDTIKIDIHPLPGISLTVTPSADLCYGIPYEFHTNSWTVGSTLYQWRINGDSIDNPTLDSTLTYNATYGDTISVGLVTDQCSTKLYEVGSNEIIMYIRPKPQLINGLSIIDSVIEFTTKSYYVTQFFGHSYLWNVSGGTILGDSTSSTILIKWDSPDTSAFVTVSETDTGKCIYKNELPIVIISSTFIQELSKISSLRIHPNPTNGRFSIELEGFSDRTISIINSLGSVVYQSIFTRNGLIEIDLPDYINDGVYLIRIVSDRELFTGKFILKRK